ncbi:MAG TPA: urea carboxylase [Solirubrobacteraceae bacterium]|jgi:urea carboxylase|nr:urea carboxylase [Solirubrobacteraceae bacterium]
MFDTVLVANRGEIACRIIRSARALGLGTVAVYSDADRGAPHVGMADAAVRLGPAPARESYLRADAVLEAARAHDAGAVHPGYGLLSEDRAFAEAVEEAGLAFVGPTPEQLGAFGAKDASRILASDAGVPLLPGSGVLADVDAALGAAEEIGYPVMLKATAGGGGIGMERCTDAAELAAAFTRVQRLADASFGAGGVFVEGFVAAARHVEVQVFGDGAGRAVVLGDRDCTLQRRNQKVLEEAPAPGLSEEVRERMASSAAALCESVGYRSAGTVEFIYDVATGRLSFLEVNARLQVEHPVTEERYGIDLVAAMLRLARGETGVLDELAAAEPRGCAVEVRLYAEDPAAGHRPSAGLLTEVVLPERLRVDGWIAAGTEVTTAYDPLLAKLIATAPTREEALDALAAGLEATRIGGIATNAGLLRATLADARVREGAHTTATLADIADPSPRIEVARGGTMTTVQDWPGRVGFWDVGVPPSGAMDDRSLRLGNLALGNHEGAPALECTLDGPALRFSHDTVVCVTGAPGLLTVAGEAVALWEPVTVPAGATLDLGRLDGPGLRAYICVAGGFDVPDHLGSAATFTLGRFGGHGGRELRAGDVLRRGSAGDEHAAEEGAPAPVPENARPPLVSAWEIGVTEGPHAAPEFFTREDIEMFYATAWQVHFNSARTGVRLLGPRPRWAREDGGEAGLHPSNIHDTPYSVGSVDYTGDLPIVLGPDGPSLGGFVCPAVVAVAERWKLGQLRPGDEVRFVEVGDRGAAEVRRAPGSALRPGPDRDDGVLGRREGGPGAPPVTWRRSGDDNLLVEYGEMVLDLGLRMRVHALAEALAGEHVPGVLELTPGVRSLQIKLDPDRIDLRRALGLAQTLENELPATRELAVSSRTVHLPLSWDDPATREAIRRYMAGVRDDAPWCPWNIEFIRRVNGLDDVEEVRRTVFEASYLVLGLGDVYLGAPVATPLDPRHRLVTTKYNPARTWTAENSVGIGGAYLCIYGMEGPGGYQFVGRTTQVWSRFRRTGPFAEEPYLLRFFDRISWYPVEAEELLELRADMAAGRLHPKIEEGTFTLAGHLDFLAAEAESIAAFRSRQGAAFAAERAAWAAAGEFDPRPEPEAAPPAREFIVPDGAVVVEAPCTANVWRIEVEAGDAVASGERLLTLEAMKMETALDAPCDGEVAEVLVAVSEHVQAGRALVIVVPRDAS